MFVSTHRWPMLPILQPQRPVITLVLLVLMLGQMLLAFPAQRRTSVIQPATTAPDSMVATSPATPLTAAQLAPVTPALDPRGLPADVRGLPEIVEERTANS